MWHVGCKAHSYTHTRTQSHARRIYTFMHRFTIKKSFIISWWNNFSHNGTYCRTLRFCQILISFDIFGCLSACISIYLKAPKLRSTCNFHRLSSKLESNFSSIPPDRITSVHLVHVARFQLYIISVDKIRVFVVSHNICLKSALSCRENGVWESERAN